MPHIDLFVVSTACCLLGGKRQKHLGGFLQSWFQAYQSFISPDCLFSLIFRLTSGKNGEMKNQMPVRCSIAVSWTWALLWLAYLTRIAVPCNYRGNDWRKVRQKRWYYAIDLSLARGRWNKWFITRILSCVISEKRVKADSSLEIINSNGSRWMLLKTITMSSKPRSSASST